MARESDENLLSLAREGEKPAFEELVRRYGSRVRRLAFRFTGNQGEAEEVAQEVFLTLYQKMGQFEGKSSFSTWLYRVTVNAALMKLRTREKFEQVPISELSEDHLPPGDEDGLDGERKLITEESLKEIEQAITDMPLDFKTVLILRDIEDFSNEETAEILQLSVPAVKSRLHRARAYLRERLEQLYRES